MKCDESNSRRIILRLLYEDRWNMMNYHSGRNALSAVNFRPVVLLFYSSLYLQWRCTTSGLHWSCRYKYYNFVTSESPRWQHCLVVLSYKCNDWTVDMCVPKKGQTIKLISLLWCYILKIIWMKGVNRIPNYNFSSNMLWIND